jgi:hypothetical protein
MDRHSYETVDQLCAALSQRSVPDPAAFEQANCIETLASHPIPGPGGDAQGRPLKHHGEWPTIPA